MDVVSMLDTRLDADEAHIPYSFLHLSEWYSFHPGDASMLVSMLASMLASMLGALE